MCNYILLHIKQLRMEILQSLCRHNVPNTFDDLRDIIMIYNTTHCNVFMCLLQRFGFRAVMRTPLIYTAKPLSCLVTSIGLSIFSAWLDGERRGASAVLVLYVICGTKSFFRNALNKVATRQASCTRQYVFGI